MRRKKGDIADRIQDGVVHLSYSLNGRWYKPSYSVARKLFQCDCEERASVPNTLCTHLKHMIEVFDEIAVHSRIRIVSYGIQQIEVLD